NILSEKLITLDKVNSIHKSDAFAYLDTDTSGTPPNYDDTVVEVTTAPGKAVQTSRNYTFRGNGTFSYPDGDTVLASFQNADSIGYFDSATGKFKGINHAYYEPYRKNIMHKLYKKSQDFPWSIGMRQVDSIAYNRDGTYLFITRHGGRVEIWSTFTGKCLAILKAFNADAKKLAVSDDGDYIAFSTCGPNIKIYRMCDIHTTDSFDLCYSDNITDWKCKYNIRGEWRFQVRKSANKLYHFIYKTQEGHKQPIAGMEFSPDKKQLLTTAYDRSVKIWDLSDASRDQYNISPHCLYSIEFIPGLKVKGAVIQNLHSSSNLTDKELESLKTYGAIL
ncbi:WD40 repeat domain-containing protein, partial [Blautia sp.]